MRVLKDRILIQRCTRESTTSKSVIITLDEKPINLFEVIDIGPDVVGVFIGDKIVPEPYALQSIGEQYEGIYVINDKQILVVL